VAVVAGVPLVALALSARWLLAYFSVWGGRPAWWVPMALIGLGVTALYGLALLWWALRLRRQAQTLAAQRTRLRERAAFFEDRSKKLAAQVELLSAMREVSRIVSDEVRFDRILDESLRIVQDLVDAQAITIFLVNEHTGSLEAAAYRGPDRATVFGRNIPPGVVDPANVEQCIEYHTILRMVERDWLTLSVPLDADQEPVGVLKITVPLAGATAEREDLAEAYDQVLPEIARHVALAVKTTHLHSRSVTDGPTGLYNKRHFQRQLAALFDFSKRYGKPFALVMVDIDHFKRINDSYGHLAGDMALAGLAHLLRQSVRKYDVACRYGGEEMAVLMPEADLRHARHLAERVRKAAAARTFGGRSRAIHLTVSCGAAAFAPEMEKAEELVALADGALYEAKQSGRNRVCTARFKRPKRAAAGGERDQPETRA
jgi:diguanylate cyclase (GGDEF)-like protein